MKIKDICEYGTKSKIYAGQGLPGGDYPFYTSSAVCNKYLDDAQFFEPGIIMGTGGNTTLHYCSCNFSVYTDFLFLFKNKRGMGGRANRESSRVRDPGQKRRVVIAWLSESRAEATSRLTRCCVDLRSCAKRKV